MHVAVEGERAKRRLGPGRTQLQAKACGFDPR